MNEENRYPSPAVQPKDAAAAISWIMEQVGYVQKVKAKELNYSFAGEADLIAALRPPMVTAHLIVFVSAILELRQATYTTKSGTVMNHATVHGLVTFRHAPSGSDVVVQACGEGADVSDKAVNKAMTGMLKYALRQTFLIETGDDPDRTQARDPEPHEDLDTWTAQADSTDMEFVVATGALKKAAHPNHLVALLNLSPFKPGHKWHPNDTDWFFAYREFREGGASAKDAATGATQQFNKPKPA